MYRLHRWAISYPSPFFFHPKLNYCNDVCASQLHLDTSKFPLPFLRYCRGLDLGACCQFYIFDWSFWQICRRLLIWSLGRVRKLKVEVRSLSKLLKCQIRTRGSLGNGYPMLGFLPENEPCTFQVAHFSVKFGLKAVLVRAFKRSFIKKRTSIWWAAYLCGRLQSFSYLVCSTVLWHTMFVWKQF